MPRQLGSIERGMPGAQDQAESSGNVFSMYIQIKPYIALHCIDRLTDQLTIWSPLTHHNITNRWGGQTLRIAILGGNLGRIERERTRGDALRTS